MTKRILNKESVYKDLKQHAKDVGSSEVQIAILTERIRYLTEHFAKNKKVGFGTQPQIVSLLLFLLKLENTYPSTSNRVCDAIKLFT